MGRTSEADDVIERSDEPCEERRRELVFEDMQYEGATEPREHGRPADSHVRPATRRAGERVRESTDSRGGGRKNEQGGAGG
eukprot:1516687-Prymnesium_polylepis.1